MSMYLNIPFGFLFAVSFHRCPVQWYDELWPPIGRSRLTFGRPQVFVKYDIWPGQLYIVLVVVFPKNFEVHIVYNAYTLSIEHRVNKALELQYILVRLSIHQKKNNILTASTTNCTLSINLFIHQILNLVLLKKKKNIFTSQNLKTWFVSHMFGEKMDKTVILCPNNIG